MMALSRPQQRADFVQRGQDALFVALRLAGWGATTLLAAIGAGLLVFLALGGFTFAGLMLQLGNLASRFSAAGAARRGEFEAIVLAIFVIVLALTAFFRRASLRAAFIPITDLTGEDQ
ncbi:MULTISPECIES: hypothetical protein [unclassified Sphingomonas]|uniref:hypothetical protein n=1 Tax=Novosphingobium rhizosphaerae TaxID=1551649 RepID=UPI0015C8EDE9